MENNENTLGAALWVNLLNTKRLVYGSVVDILEDKAKLMAWQKDNELALDGGDSQIEKFKELRGMLHAFMEELLKGVPLTEIKALDEINKKLKSLPVRLEASSHQEAFTMKIHAYDQLNESQLQILLSFLSTGKEHGFEKVKQCAHEECILYFLDTSKSGKRKWCSMETCGNRKKVSKHYHKNKGS